MSPRARQRTDLSQQRPPAITLRPDDFKTPESAARAVKLAFDTLAKSLQEGFRLVDEDPRMSDSRVAYALDIMQGEVSLDKAQISPNGSIAYVINGGRDLVFGTATVPAPTGGGSGPGAAAVVPQVEELGVYGDGVDGNATLDGTNTYSWASKAGSVYSLLRDVYLDTLTINSGSTLNGPYRVFCKTLCEVKSGGTFGFAASAGTAGTNFTAGASTGGTGGGATTTGTLGNNGVGGNGRPGTVGAGAAASVHVAAQGEGGDGGSGGNGGNGSTAAGGATGASVPEVINRFRSTTSVGMVYNVNDVGGLYLVMGGTGGRGGSSGGGDSAFVKGGAGGGGGAGGTVLALWAKAIICAGTISANGAAGGHGGNGDGITCGPGGGGGGGGGGFVYLYYDTLTNTGTISAAGGAGGAAGINEPFNAAGAGGAGSAGSIVKYSRLTGLFT